MEDKIEVGRVGGAKRGTRPDKMIADGQRGSVHSYIALAESLIRCISGLPQKPISDNGDGLLADHIPNYNTRF